MRWLVWSVLVCCSFPLLAQSPATQPVTGYCNLGGAHAAVSGLQATNFQQGIIPGCRVSVYLHGTQTLATIYADDNNTPLSNPFTATVAGSPDSGAWIFWAANGSCYDVVGNGGVPPIIYPQPITLTEVCLNSGGGGGSGCTVSSLPLYSVVSNNPIGTCYGDADFIYDTASYAKKYVVIDNSAGITSGSIVNSNEEFGFASVAGPVTSFNTALGNGAQATDGYNIAIGTGATAGGGNFASEAIAIGSVNTLSLTEDGIAIGSSAECSSTAGDTCIAIGLGADNGFGDGDVISIGNGTTNPIGTGFFSDNIMIGDGAECIGLNCVSIGNGTGRGTMEFDDTVTIGDGASCTTTTPPVDTCVAIGNGAQGQAQETIAMGTATAGGEDTIGLGMEGGHGAPQLSGFGSIAIGSGIGGAVNDNGHDDVMILGNSLQAAAAHNTYISSPTTTDVTLCQDSTDPCYLHNAIINTPTIFSHLPSCTSALEGLQWPVTDSTTSTWGATITGSGSDHVLAYCDGTNWTVAAK